MFTINQKHLKAVSYFQAHNDIRIYLNGVLAEFSPCETRLIATNGHVLAAYRTAAENTETGSIIIPAETIKTMLQWKHRNLANIRIDNRGDEFRAELGENVAVFKPIDGEFPNYRQVLPKNTVTGEACQINPNLLALFARAGEAMGTKSSRVMVGYNGDRHGGGPCLVEVNGNPDFIGVVMPMRCEGADIPKSSPSWVTAKLPQISVEQAA
jgi:DNA polymerase III subunit beta